jgi:hypothetical protein
MMNFNEHFSELEMLMKQTPNLKCLMISSTVGIDIADARRWEDSITTALLLLTNFKFEFDSFCELNEKDTALANCEKFQSDF